MDLSALFAAISKQAVEAAKPTISAFTGEPEGYYLVARPTGELTRHEAARPWRNHQCHAIADFCSYVCGGADAKVNGEFPPVVWYSRAGAVAILNDDASRRDRVTLPLKLSPQIEKLIQIAGLTANGGWWSQADFVRLLRISFKGCLDGISLLSVIRNVKFTTNAQGAGVIQHTKRSTGQSIESEITGEGTIPEEVVLRVPVFVGMPVAATVHCAIEVDPTKGNFQLVPFPDAIEGAIRYGETWLGEQLGEGIEDAASVYFGVA
jgi:hypothetical protein